MNRRILTMTVLTARTILLAGFMAYLLVGM